LSRTRRNGCAAGVETSSDRSSVARQVDWVAKEQLLEAYMARHEIDWTDPRVRMLDLQYHDMRPERSLFARLDTERLLSEESVIEAITESFDAKRELFKRLDGICKEEAILASNTSSIPITRMAAVTRRADRFIGMHFFNPVPVMPLVEITRGRDTSEATLGATLELAKTLGKTPIISLDYPGFIVNRMLVPFINEAIRALMEGLGTREDIDQGAKLGLHHPMGPLELADFVGLDTHLYICGVLYEGLHDARFAAPALLQQLVDAGHYGRKTGRGFYRYSAEGTRLPD